jgi:group I intron endonuclease
MTKFKKVCVYVITSKIHPERLYIGSTVDFTARKSHHTRALEKGEHHNRILQNHFNKYGIDDLSFDIIELIEFESKEHLLSREQYFINTNPYKNTNKPYFNITPTAGSVLGCKMPPISEEKREKLRKASTGKRYALGNKLSDETKKRISEVKKGVPLSEDHKKSLSKGWDKRRLKPESDVTKQRRRDAQLGRKMPPRTEQWRERMSKSKTGKKRPQHEKDKISATMKGMKHSPEWIENARKARSGMKESPEVIEAKRQRALEWWRKKKESQSQ